MQPDIYIYGLTILFGLAVGSFLNVLIYRLPREKKTIFRRSFCPVCRNKIAFYHNIPLISYIVLLGKCKTCGSQISPRYPVVELLNCLAYLLVLYLDNLSLQLPFHFFLVSSLIVIFFIDIEFQIIPDKITLPGIVIGLIFPLVADNYGFLDALLGLFVGGGALLAVAYLGEWLFKKEAMGGGDIKMAAMMGAFVGWQKVLIIFLGGAVVGMLVSIVWMAMSPKIRSKRLIPFGPFLAIAAFVVIVYGDTILNFYINNFLNV